MDFDPFDVDAMLRYEGDVVFPLVWRVGDHRKAEPLWVCDWAGEEIARWIVALREAVKLPLEPIVLAGAEETLGMLEAAKSQRNKTKRTSPLNDDWLTADLQAEIQAVAGVGKQVGKKLWYRCPLHQDKTASLEVDPALKLWHCFGCDKKGGVYAWRQAVRSL